MKPIAAPSPTYASGVYSWQYRYATGVMVLSVSEFRNAADTTQFFDQAKAARGTRRTIQGLGADAFQTNDGSVVVRKDFKVLDVDVRGTARAVRPARPGTRRYRDVGRRGGHGLLGRLTPPQCDSRETASPLAPTRKSRSAPVSACITWST